MRHILTALELQIFKKKFKKFIGNKNVLTNISRIQAYDSIICRYFCFRLIDLMLEGQSLIDYRNLFSLINMKKKAGSDNSKLSSKIKNNVFVNRF